MTEREVLRMLRIHYPAGEEAFAMRIVRENLRRAQSQIDETVARHLQGGST